MAKKKQRKGKARAHRPRKTPEEAARLIRDATRLLCAKHNPLSVKAVAIKLGLPYHWVYYNVRRPLKMRAA
jgi:hypothetical protein